MENVVEKKNKIGRKLIALFAILAFAGLTVAGVVPYQEIFNLVFGTVDPGIVSEGFAAPASITMGSAYIMTGNFTNNANQAYALSPSVKFVADTAFTAIDEFGVVSLDGNPSTCVITTSVALDDTLSCPFSAIALSANGGNSGDIDLNFEIPMYWDGSALSIGLVHS